MLETTTNIIMTIFPILACMLVGVDRKNSYLGLRINEYFFSQLVSNIVCTSIL